jgi:hypothetical protein
LQLREFDLSLALGTPRVCGEDVKNQRRTVDDLDTDAVLKIPQLRKRQLTVADDRIRSGGDDHVP